MPDEPIILPLYPNLERHGALTLRPYQRVCVDEIYTAWNEYRAVLAVLATGLGKTVIAAEVSLRWPEQWGKILFIAHREELIDQGRDKIGLHTGDFPEVEMGQRWASLDTGLVSNSRVVVASIQTLSRRKRRERYNPDEFGLVIVDEAHHATAASYLSVLEYFKRNPNYRILGITATPKRHDKIGMRNVFEHCCFELDIREGIDDGWLVPVQQKFVVVEGLDFSVCRKTAGDFNQSDLTTAMMGGESVVQDHELSEVEIEQLKKQEAMIHRFVDPTIREANGRPTLVFCVTKEHAVRTCEIFRRHDGITAEVVIDSTPPDRRKAITEGFRKGEIQVLVGVGCFTEGFDAPDTAVVAICRPTQSEALYKQMIGRGTRPLPGLVDACQNVDERRAAIEASRKPFVTVLDFVGASGKHSLVSTFNVLAGDSLPDDVLDAIEAAKDSGEAINVDQAIEAARERREERERQEEERRKRADQEAKRRAAEAAERARLEEEERRRRLIGKTTYHTIDVDPQRGAPEQRQQTYRGGATDEQVRQLVSLGCRRETAMGFGQKQAREVIRNMTERAVAKFSGHDKRRHVSVSRAYILMAQTRNE